MDIPYEAQLRQGRRRWCGAAALVMVYRSLGIDCSQPAMWEAIARPSRAGRPAARTYLLAADALRRGLAAVVFEAADPWRALRRCAEHGLRAIVNHRVRADSPLGHYSVLVEIDDQHAVLHDPQWGPARRLARSDLLSLWLPSGEGCEIRGRVLVAVAKPELAARLCPTCGTPPPATVVCPRCRGKIPFSPSAALGCTGASCPSREWETVFCPHCDAGLRSETA